MKKIKVPILIIGFNRPDIIEKTFRYIRKARPSKLYVAIDGARPDKAGEDKLVKLVKGIVENVDWDCKTHYKYNETNKGAEITVSSAISWVFEKEEYAIILEDDIIAPLSFLKFAQEMLIKYKDDERIGTVTGSNFTPIPVPKDTDYFFAKYGHSWGWATWKRSWQSYNLNVDIPAEHVKMSFLKTLANSRNEAKFLQRRFKSLKKAGPGNNTWDAVGFYRFKVKQALCITPRVNLTSNIGEYGLHARGKTEHHHRLFDKNFEVKKHPEKIEAFTAYDNHHLKTYLNRKTSICKRVLRKIQRIIKVK